VSHQNGGRGEKQGPFRLPNIEKPNELKVETKKVEIEDFEN